MSLLSERGRSKAALAVALCLMSLSLGASAHAGLTIVDIGGGWQAEIDSDLNGLVSINPLAVDAGLDAVFIQKSAEFTSLATINVVFRQISPNALSNIVIDDEIITNSSGVTWTDFHMDLSGALNNVAFDPAATAASGGFSVGRFASSSFTNANTTFNAFGGSIPTGGIWFPGVVSGQLWININLQGKVDTVFTLGETPTIPAPGALALLGLAGFSAIRRRRRQ